MLLASAVSAQNLKIKSDQFEADQKAGISIFTGNVNIVKYNDELNASKVTVYTDKKNQPTKFVAVGNAKFKIKTQEGIRYQGRAHKVIYLPLKKEYQFYKDVHLKQLGENKDIFGDEVILNTTEGKAHANSTKGEPVIMIFELPPEEKK
jgi:lipopolysaccharide export system protein LptA